MKGWKKYNPDYEIILLTKKNYKGYVTIPYELTSHPNFNDCPQRFADLVRIWTLTEHGGVWIDSTILLKGPIDDWLFPKYAECSGFYRGGFTKRPEFPVIENWFFACNKGSPFMKKWRDEFSEISRYASVDDYVDSRRRSMNVDQIEDPITNAIQVAVYQILMLYPKESLILHKNKKGIIL